MGQKKEIFTVFSAGLLQGVCLVTFPAVSSILTNPELFNLSSAEYGALFIPQSIISIVASLYSSKLNKKWPSKTVFFLGVIANIISMALLAISPQFMHNETIKVPYLMLSTAFLGLGFGLTVPTLNIMTALFKPEKVDSMILVLNALLGVGTTLSPIFVALFVGFGIWWGLPTLLVVSLILLLLFSLPLHLPGGGISVQTASKAGMKIPSRFWLFALFALLYGTIETLNGNWALLYMKEHAGAAITYQSLSLTFFWGAVTLGRVFFAAVEKIFKEVWTYQLLPFLAIGAFIVLATLPKDEPYLAIAAFGFSGFCCSALLPLTISFGQVQLHSMATFVTAGIVAAYLTGYGIAAFGVGGLKKVSGMPLNEIFGIGAILAASLVLLAYFLVREKKVFKDQV